MDNLQQIEKAKNILNKHGYYTLNLWCIEDVQTIFDCTEAEAILVLHKALQSDGVMEQIWFDIEYFGEEYKLKKKKNE